MGREGLMDDAGYHGFDNECPEEPTRSICERCIYWDSEECCCEIYKEFDIVEQG